MKSPFKFLDSYTKDDREIFFGPDRQIFLDHIDDLESHGINHPDFNKIKELLKN